MTRILKKQRETKKLILLGEYVDYWYKTYKMPKHEISTIHVQLNYINTHIKPSKLGNMIFSTVRTAHIQEFLKDLLTTGNKCKLKNSQTYGNPLANATVKKIRAILVAAFKQAFKENIILKNYAEDTESIVLQKSKEYVFFSEKEEKLFLKKTQNHRFHLAYRLMFLTGCRRSEILGLSWNDIDFLDKYFTVRQVLLIPDKIPIIKKRPKTSASLRSIPLPTNLIKALKEHRRDQEKEAAAAGSDWGNQQNNLVFVTKNGDPYNPKNFSQNIKKKIKRLGFNPKLHAHSTRHTFASNMLQMNVPIPDVKALGGWSSADVLLDIYAHTVQASHRKAINKLYDRSH